jgi:hypothetical protein
MKYNQMILINNELCNIKISILHVDYDNIDMDHIEGYLVTGDLLEKLKELAKDYNTTINKVISEGLEYIE